GDYGKVWAARDYVAQARKVRAAVMVVHGVNDWNVKMKNSVQWWNALKQAGVPRKLWLHQGDHATPFGWRLEEWLRQTHRWFDRYLHGIRNGIEHEPRVDVQRADGTWETARDWPVPGTRTVPLSLNAGPSGQPGGLGPLPRPGAPQSFTDEGRTRTAEQLLAREDEADPGRLAYLTGPLAAPVRVNGTPRVTLRASLDGRSPYLTVLLVDYGERTRPTGRRADTGERVCDGERVPRDDGCTTRQPLVTATAPSKITPWGCLDGRHRRAGLLRRGGPGRRRLHDPPVPGDRDRPLQHHHTGVAGRAQPARPRPHRAPPTRQDLHVPLGTGTDRLHGRARSPARRGRAVHRPRLHAAVSGGHRGHRRAGREPGHAAAHRGRRQGAEAGGAEVARSRPGRAPPAGNAAGRPAAGRRASARGQLPQPADLLAAL